MSVETIKTPHAPEAVGPYSQGVLAGCFLYASGQIPLDPKTGKLVSGDLETQVRQIFSNLDAVLKAGESSFEDVVKTTVYLISMDDFPTLNKIYADYFPNLKPARSTFAVAALPLGARVEIDLVAKIPK